MEPYTITIEPGKLLSAEEFANLPEDAEWQRELDQGKVIRMPLAGAQHDTIVRHLASVVGEHVSAHQLGEWTLPPAGYEITWPNRPATVWIPDLAFLRAGRLPALTSRKRTPFPKLAPDLVAEVACPGQLTTDLTKRAERWLRAGTEVVWMLWPDTRQVQIWWLSRKLGQPRLKTVSVPEELYGMLVLPGFSTPVAALFG